MLDKDNIVAFPAEGHAFAHKHLLGIEQLTPPNIATILDLTAKYFHNNRAGKASDNILGGLCQANIFFEDSTRTRESFDVAGTKLGANIICPNLAGTSRTKGETEEDTIATLSAMRADTNKAKRAAATKETTTTNFALNKNNTIEETIAAINELRPDILVLRHATNGAVADIAAQVSAAVINAGDGTNEHPTQALLDAFVIREHFGKLAGLRVAICGDVAHSRVARSNIILLQRMGAQVHVVAPDELLSVDIKEMGAKVFTNMKDGLHGCDVVMALRIQFERIKNKLPFSREEYFKEFGLGKDKLKYAKPEAVIMHPGPINRGIEIDSSIADHPTRSLIKMQVEAGVATRQAVLELLAGNIESRPLALHK